VKVGLKIWRFDAETGDRALKEYEVEAPEWVTLLDVLDIVKDRQDGTLSYRKSCRMMICGSCGMRMDGAAVLACKTRMYDIAQSGHVPVISPMGNLPVIKDLVVDMNPFWGKIRSVKPWLDPGYDEVAEKERIVSQQQMNVIHKEALCIMCGCCVSECNSMESTSNMESGIARGATSATSGVRKASTLVMRSPSSAPSRFARASITTWAQSTRSGSCIPRRRRAGCGRRS
jgi:succinate dehydrogenase / fumarate reductase iron-sulfur subunit